MPFQDPERADDLRRDALEAADDETRDRERDEWMENEGSDVVGKIGAAAHRMIEEVAAGDIVLINMLMEEVSDLLGAPETYAKCADTAGDHSQTAKIGRAYARFQKLEA